ncbi:MAG TPA: cytochrome P450 [Candidatus Binataceae bacterium]|nr:cytochrome P450 [Candidatus Binataceae bacterium]
MKLAEIDSLLTDLDYFQQHDVPHEAFVTLRREDPVHHTHRDFPYGFWSVTKFDDALAVYRAPERFSSHHGLALTNSEIEENQYGTSMIAADPPFHNKQRRLISMRLTPRQVLPEEKHIRAIVTSIIDQVAPRGECDFVTDIAAQMPTAVICEMMGVPREDWEDMFHWGNLLIGSQDPEYREAGDSAKQTAEKGRIAVYNYYMKLIAQRRKNPGDDLVSALVHGDMSGEKMTDMDILANCLLLILGGQETTRNAMSGGMMQLMLHPDQKAKVMAERSLIKGTIEEFLRWTSPITHLMRTATADAEVHGKRIKKGDKVVVWNVSANRDEDEFSDPFKFDVTRTPNDHLAFAHGEHFCVGANLARLELRVMLDELLTRLPDIQPAGKPERLRSNFVAGIKHMPVKFRPARAAAA